MIDEAAKAQLSREIYQRRSVDVGDTRANANDAESDDEDLIGYDSIAPGLPPASSDNKKWWLGTGDPSLVRWHLSRVGLTFCRPSRAINLDTATRKRHSKPRATLESIQCHKSA